MDEHLLRFKKDTDYVLIDCETENLCLNRSQNVPWQVGMVRAKGDKKVDEKDFYIGWEREVNVGKEAARITRFSPTQYRKRAIPYKEAFPTIKDWLENCDYIIGHNILGFDIYLIKDYYNMMGENYHHLMSKIIDTNSLARGIKYGILPKKEENFLSYQYKILHTRRKGVKSSLTALGKEYGIDFDPDKLHEAVYDLELNLKVWNKIKWQIEI